jgi:hypothetical protein
MALDLVISFDDTGSMSSVRRMVRSQIETLVKQLFDLVPDLRIGIIIHNDYCDRDLIQRLELTNSKKDIIEFIGRSSSNGGGGNGGEAYAFVLNQIRQFGWESANRIAVVIGDEPPHEKGAVKSGITEQYDWREESTQLGISNIPIYSIQALGDKRVSYFYKAMADLSNGIKLDLSQFSHITDYILAILHKQNDTLDDFQNTRAEYTTNISLANMFAKLRGIADGAMAAKYETLGDLLGRFQVVSVPTETRIKNFVENMGLHYERGKGYYQFVSSEKIQPSKEIFFINKSTGEPVMDTNWCREQMGLKSDKTVTVSPRNVACSRDYDIFVQSTSYTRKLDAGTKFMYELNKH